MPEPVCPICRGTTRPLYAATTDSEERLYRPSNFRCTTVNTRDHGAVFRCNECRAGFIWPQPDARQISLLYREGDDAAYLEERAGRERTWQGDIRRWLKDGNGRRLLDVGCHAGLFLALARQQGWQVEGVEPNDWARSHACTQLGLPVEADLSRIAQASFDAITLFDVIEHLPDPGSMLRALRRLARPGGRLILTTPNLDSALANVLRSRWYCIRQQHLFYFTPRSLRVLLGQTGWQPQRSGIYLRRFSLSYWADKLRQYNRWIGQPVQTLARPLKQVFLPLPFDDQLYLIATAV